MISLAISITMWLAMLTSSCFLMKIFEEIMMIAYEEALNDNIYVLTTQYHSSSQTQSVRKNV
jgi:hypothetical protein